MLSIEPFEYDDIIGVHTAPAVFPGQTVTLYASNYQ